MGKKLESGKKGEPRKMEPSPSAHLCAKCGKEACIYQAYSRTALCRAHFERQLEERFRKTIREFSMIRAREHIAVALSGGKDSIVMLHLLCRLKKKLPMKISAILVDEGIGGYRQHSVKTAKEECRKLGVRLHITSFRKEFGKSLDAMLKRRGKTGIGGYGACSFCGVFRRTLLNRAARKIGADKLAVGHNLDDCAQTVLMNMMRNEPARLARFGIAGGVTEGGGLVARIKPMARLPEKEIALWAVLRGIKIHFMQCPYAEEALRQEVRRLLNSLEEKYPGTKYRVFGSFLSMRPPLMEWARKKAARDGGIGVCTRCNDASSGGECASCRLLGAIGISK